jgi:hypothetical protein
MLSAIVFIVYFQYVNYFFTAEKVAGRKILDRACEKLYLVSVCGTASPYTQHSPAHERGEKKPFFELQHTRLTRTQ